MSYAAMSCAARRCDAVSCAAMRDAAMSIQRRVSSGEVGRLRTGSGSEEGLRKTDAVQMRVSR